MMTLEQRCEWDWHAEIIKEILPECEVAPVSRSTFIAADDELQLLRNQVAGKREYRAMIAPLIVIVAGVAFAMGYGMRHYEAIAHLRSIGEVTVPLHQP